MPKPYDQDDEPRGRYDQRDNHLHERLPGGPGPSNIEPPTEADHWHPGESFEEFLRQREAFEAGPDPEAS